MIPLRAYKRKYLTVYRYSLLAEALAGHPSKNSNNRGARWEEGTGGSLSSLFPLPIVPHALQRGLCGGESNK